MTKSAGDRLGPYEILAPIGAGGMGEVYRARDTKLDRDVAIKVLPQLLANDPERLARFEREAKVLASLNHPNIAQIYGLEQRALVMELVAGETLKGPLPVETALNYARQIACALEAAHEKGITHRDLKPANIMITPAGVIKVLDFGLAAVAPASVGESDPTNSPTLTMRATQAGMIMGTAAYMSPEQASGKPVDKRADIWSFGVVLFELLTGRRLFGDAETISHTLADVLRGPIDFEKLPKETPKAIRDLLRRCLDRDVKSRLRDIGEARVAIDKAGKEPEVAATAVREPRRRMLPLAAGAAVMALIAAFALFGWWRATRPIDRPLMRMSVDLGPDAVAGQRTTVAISPDGTRIVFPMRGTDGKQVLATRVLDQDKATLLAGTEEASDPFFSPDAQWIGFFTGNKMQKISIQGGAPVVLGDVSNPRGASWGEDGTIVAELVNTNALARVSASGGGAPQPLTQLKPGEATHRWPQVLPGGQAVVFTANNNISAFDEASIEVLNLKTNQRKTLWRGGYFGRYLPAENSRGYLVYIHQGTLFGAPFDPARLELQGTPAPLLEDVASDPTTAAGQLDFSRTGTLVYRSGKAVGRTWPVVWLDSAGKTQPLLAKAGTYYTPRISPDGQRLAVMLESGKDQELWIYDQRRDTMSRLTYTGQGFALHPVWSPDGKHLAFESRSAGVRSIGWIRSDGAGQALRLLESKNEVPPASFSPDGRRLAYTERSPETGFDLWTLTLDLSDPEHPKPGKPELFLRTPFNEQDGVFSPDGRWIAYTSDESGARELYVRPFPGPGGKWQISTGGAKYPRWAPKEHTLFYASQGDVGIMAVDYTATADSFSASRPRLWAALPMIDATGDVNLDVAPDGKRFAVFPAPDAKEGDKGSVQVTFLLNFFEELQRKAGVRSGGQ